MFVCLHFTVTLRKDRPQSDHPNLEMSVEKVVIVVAITVAVVAIAYLFGRSRPASQQLKRTVIAAIAAAIAGSATVYGLEYLTGSDTELVDQAVSEARALPLVGLVLDDVPDAEARLRKALSEELRSPTTQGPPRPLALMTELRATQIVPALKATDAADAQAVLAARLALMRHLKSVDPATCRELVLIGIQRGEKLDATAQKLMRDMLAAMEKAYRAGRAALKASTAPPPALGDADVTAVLGEAGLTPADFEKLRTLQRLSNEEACDLGIKLNEAPVKLPADKAGALARYLAAAQ